MLGAVGVELDGPIGPGPQAGAVWLPLAAALDHGGHFSSVAMAARSTLSLYDGHEAWAVGLEDLEAEQGHDLAVRLGGIAAGLAGAPGGLDAAQQTETFPALVWYLAAVDVVLAYGTEMDPVDAGKVDALVDRHSLEIGEFHAALDADMASGDVLAEVVAEVEEAVAALPDVVTLIAEAVRGVLPDIEGSTEAFKQEARDTPVIGLLMARLRAELDGTLGTGAEEPTKAPATEPPEPEPEPDPEPEPEPEPEPDPEPEPEPEPEADPEPDLEPEAEPDPEPDPEPEPLDPLHAARRRAERSGYLARRAAIAAQQAYLQERREQLLARSSPHAPVELGVPQPEAAPAVAAARDGVARCVAATTTAQESRDAVAARRPRPPAGTAPGAAEAARVDRARGRVADAEDGVAAARTSIQRFHDAQVTRKAGHSRIEQLRKRRLELVSEGADPRRRKRCLLRDLDALPATVEVAVPDATAGVAEARDDAEAAASGVRAALAAWDRARAAEKPVLPAAPPPTDAAQRLAAAREAVSEAEAAVADARTAVADASTDRAEQRTRRRERRQSLAETRTALESRRQLLGERIAAASVSVEIRGVAGVRSSLRLAVQAARAGVEAAEAFRDVCLAGRPADIAAAPPAPADTQPLKDAVEAAEAAVSQTRADLVDACRARLLAAHARQTASAAAQETARARRLALREATTRTTEPGSPVPSFLVDETLRLEVALTSAALDEARDRLSTLAGAAPEPPAAAPPVLDGTRVSAARLAVLEAGSATEEALIEARELREKRAGLLATMRDLAADKRSAITTLPAISPATPAAPDVSTAGIDAAATGLRRAEQRRSAARPPVRHARRELARMRAEARGATARIATLDERIDDLTRSVRRLEDAVAQARRSGSAEVQQKRSVSDLLSRIKKGGPPPIASPPPPLAAPPSWDHRPRWPMLPWPPRRSATLPPRSVRGRPRPARNPLEYPRAVPRACRPSAFRRLRSKARTSTQRR